MSYVPSTVDSSDNSVPLSSYDVCSATPICGHGRPKSSSLGSILSDITNLGSKLGSVVANGGHTCMTVVSIFTIYVTSIVCLE